MVEYNHLTEGPAYVEPIKSSRKNGLEQRIEWYKDRSEIEGLKENQIKIIKKIYLKDDTKYSAWLGRVARNVALGELIYVHEFHQRIFEGVDYKTETKTTVDGQTTDAYLLHDNKGVGHSAQRDPNFNMFRANLYMLRQENQEAQSLVDKVEEEFYSMLYQFRFIPNSPTLMNAGRDLQQLSACYVLPIDDTIESWGLTTLNTMLIHKSGGGTGFSGNRVRPRGDTVKGSYGTASGPISVFEIIDKATQEVKQGGTRRGANMGILPYNHPDIREFIEYKKKKPGHLENFNVSVGITQEFVNALEKGETYLLINPRTGKVQVDQNGNKVSENASEIWNLIIQSAWETGDPGYVVIDRINNSTSNPTPAIGNIEATNPCVAEGTLVNTPNGFVPVENIKVGDLVSTVFGYGPVKTIEIHENTPVFKVKFSDGGEQIVTAAHRYFAIKKGSQSKKLSDIRLDQLQPGDYVRVKSTLLQNYSPEDYFKGLKTGILLGDWCYAKKMLSKGTVKIASNKEDIEYNKNIKMLFGNLSFQKDDTSSISKSVNMILSNGQQLLQEVQLNSAYSFEKSFDNTNIRTKDMVLGILDGLLATDGDINLKSNHPQIRFVTSSEALAQNIRRLLLMIGCHGRISKSFYDDGGKINGRKIIRKHDKFSICLSGESARTFAKYSLLKNINPKKGNQLQNLRKQWMATGNTWKARIISIEPMGNAKVFDLYNEASDTWITDGYVQRGCGEQPLLPNEPCNLGSINLFAHMRRDDGRALLEIGTGEDITEFNRATVNGSAYLDMQALERTVKSAVRFLDNVIDVNNYPLPEIEVIAKSNRRIGLGIMGLAETFSILGIAYDSEEAVAKTRGVMKFINEKAHDESKKLAQERGIFPNFKNSIFDENGSHFRPNQTSPEYYPRNCAVTTIAPTGTIALAAGLDGQGIEPFFAIALERYTADGLDAKRHGEQPKDRDILKIMNTLFEEVAQENNYFGLTRDELWQRIKNSNGSVRHLEEIPEEIRRAFPSAHDIDLTYHVGHQAATQEHTDNAVSKTINFPKQATVEDVNAAYWLAYKSGCKGITIYRDGSKKDQVLNLGAAEKKGETVAASRACDASGGISSEYYEIRTGYGPLHM